MVVKNHTASYMVAAWEMSLGRSVRAVFIPSQTGVSPYRQYVMTT